MTLEQYKKLPRIVNQLCELFDCMIIGSTVDGKVSDIDMIVPFDKWQTCASFIMALNPVHLASTRFGGWRWVEPELARSIDIWPSSIEQVLKSSRPSNIYWPKHRLLIKREFIHE